VNIRRETAIASPSHNATPSQLLTDSDGINEKENGKDSEWNDSAAGWIFDRADEYHSNGERQELYGRD
jgi:hypothetical protein